MASFPPSTATIDGFVRIIQMGATIEVRTQFLTLRALVLRYSRSTWSRPEDYERATIGSSEPHPRQSVTGVPPALFAKLRAVSRKATARTKDQLWSIIGRFLDTCLPAECTNCLANAGYGSILSERALGFSAPRSQGSSGRFGRMDGRCR